METNQVEKIASSPSGIVRFVKWFNFGNTLSRYILREHIGPLIFAFTIITFILIIDFIPSLVDMIVGKDLPALVVFKVFVYQLGWIVALAVPMAVLVATLMAFGRLTSDQEINAIKSSGIHILRVLFPVILAAVIVTGIMIEFGNQVLPELNHRARVLMQDIRRMRPTLQIRSGAFVTDISGYIILIDSVDHKTSNLTGVKIMEMGQKRRAPRTIVAQSGRLTFTNYGRDLIFDLREGEIHEFDEKSTQNYRRIAFTTQRIVVSDVAEDFRESDDQYRTDREKSAEQMLEDIMKWQTGIEPYRNKIHTLVGENIERLFSENTPLSADTGAPDYVALNHLAVAEEANSRIIAREREGIDTQQKLIDSYYVEVYKKYSIPTACIVFVLIGAPLGVLARRGSMGIGIGISLGLFIMYWAFLIGGEDLADRGIMTPFWAMWSANIILGLIGLYLLYIVAYEKGPWTIFRFTRQRIRRPA